MFQFARMLSERGVTVTNGLTADIDGSAHRGVLDNGDRAVAVHGCGVDRIHSAQQKASRQTILPQGVVSSEFPLSDPPCSYRFSRRNRIIFGLCVEIFVVQAAANGGSISTPMHSPTQP